MKKKSFLIYSILIILSIFIVFMFIKIKANNLNMSAIEFDNKIDKNANFIDANKSNNFDYVASITINGIKENNGFISLQFVIDITPKTDITYKNVLATAFMDNIIDYLVVKTYTSFGTDISDKQLLDKNSINNKGLSIGKATWLFTDVNINNLTNELEKGIKVKVSWDNNTEYVNIPKENINIDIKK